MLFVQRLHMSRFGILVSVLMFAALVGCSSPLNAREAESGDVVRVNYTLTLSDGSIADTSEGRAPLEFTLGAGEVVPGFDREVTGLAEGESTEFTLEPEEGYGEPKPELVLELPRNTEQEEEELEVGATVYLSGPNNIPIPAKVLELSDETVKLDANHPLAGEELTFAVELIEIVEGEETASAEDSGSGEDVSGEP